MPVTLREGRGKTTSVARVGQYKAVCQQIETTFAREEEMGSEEARQEGLTQDEINEGELESAAQALCGHQAELEWLNGHLQTFVRVVFNERETVRGLLMQFDEKTLVLKRDTEQHDLVLVFKSMVECIKESPPTTG